LALIIRLSDQAKVNLLEIREYIRRDNPDAAVEVVRGIWNKIEFLAASPNAGRGRDDLRKGLRSYPAGRYLIFYSMTGTHVLISRVIHGNRDLAAIFETENYDTFRMSEGQFPTEPS
jgi:toxin ParE1/3/4